MGSTPYQLVRILPINRCQHQSSHYFLLLFRPHYSVLSNTGASDPYRPTHDDEGMSAALNTTTSSQTSQQGEATLLITGTEKSGTESNLREQGTKEN